MRVSLRVIETKVPFTHLNRKVVVGPINVGRNDRGEFAAVLVLVTLVQHVNHPLRVGVAFVLIKCNEMKHQCSVFIEQNEDTKNVLRGEGD
jgi:hypothetical protein